MREEVLTILLVEDNPGDARLIQVLLAEEAGDDFRIHCVERLSDAISALEKGGFDVVLLDLSLPDSHGLETLERLRLRTGSLPVVILSGLDNEEVALAALQSGAQDYLVKGRADGHLIKRSILYALERHRIRQWVLLAEAAFRATDTGIVVLDAGFRVLRVNQAFSRMTGYEPDQVIGQPPFMLGSGEETATYYEVMLEETHPDLGWEGEVWNRRSTGETYPVWLRLNAVRDDVGALSGYVCVLSDITHRKKMEEELVRQATRDHLTGLPNRSLLRRLMNEMADRTRESGRGCAFLFVDLDGFKAVNDTYGHDVGDELLKDVARRLRGAIRASDEVGRMGGDEFVVLLSHIDRPEDAAAVASKIVQMVAEPYRIGDVLAHVSASVGVAMAPDDGTTAEDLLKAADEAMYQAKNAGKNQWWSRTVCQTVVNV